MVFDVADVDRPLLVPPLGGKRHRLWLMQLRSDRLGGTEITVQRQDAAAGSRGEVGSLLEQRRVNPERTEFGIRLEAADGDHRLEVDLARRVMGCSGAIGEPRPPLVVPAPEHVVDRRPGGPRSSPRRTRPVPLAGRVPTRRLKAQDGVLVAAALVDRGRVGVVSWTGCAAMVPSASSVRAQDSTPVAIEMTTGQGETYTLTSQQLDDARDYIYCELVLDYGDPGSDIYSTSPLALCDVDWWDGLDLEALAEAFGADQAIKNGPQQ